MVNSYAGRLTFADATVRTRRDHVKYLTMIAAITLLHQHQRQVKTISRGGSVIRYVELRPPTWSWPAGWPRRCWPGRWTSCRPARAAVSPVISCGAADALHHP